jgi:hypothetical protein
MAFAEPVRDEPKMTSGSPVDEALGDPGHWQVGAVDDPTGNNCEAIAAAAHPQG